MNRLSLWISLPVGG